MAKLDNETGTKKIDVIKAVAAGMDKLPDAMKDTLFKPYPVKEVELIGVPLLGVPCHKQEPYMQMAVVAWLKQSGLLVGTTLQVPKHVLAQHGQYVYRKTNTGLDQLINFSWDGKPVVVGIYN